MQKILRIFLVLLGQGGLLALLWSIWLWFGAPLTDGVADPIVLSGPLTDTLLDELKHGLAQAIAIAWGIAMVCTFTWLLWSSFRIKILTPENLNTTGWWTVSAAGVLATAVITYPTLRGIAPLNSDWRIPLEALCIVIFLLVYALGSHFTPPMLRAAVPLPYRQPRA